MSERIRFHLDEHMSARIAAELRRNGVEVTTTIEAGLRTGSDEAQFAFACAEHRVIITDDRDFLRLAAQTADHPGVAFCTRSKHTLGEIIEFALLIHGVLEPADMIGRVEYL